MIISVGEMRLRLISTVYPFIMKSGLMPSETRPCATVLAELSAACPTTLAEPSFCLPSHLHPSAHLSACPLYAGLMTFLIILINAASGSRAKLTQFLTEIAEMAADEGGLAATPAVVWKTETGKGE